MKKIEAVIAPFKLDQVKAILAQSKILRVSVFEVKGAGREQGRLKEYRGARYVEDAAEIKIELIGDDDEAEALAERIAGALQSGALCDGEVVVLAVQWAQRVRAGGRAASAAALRENAAARPQRAPGAVNFLRALKRKLQTGD